MIAKNRLSPEELSDRENAFAWRMQFKPEPFRLVFGEESRQYLREVSPDIDDGMRIRHIKQFVGHLATLDSQALVESYRLKPDDLTIMQKHLFEMGFPVFDSEVGAEAIVVYPSE